jgi:AAA+ ATPase superfamily predicted ATPase
MGTIEKLEKEIDYLREKYKNYFLLVIALLSGESGLIYAVISGDKPVSGLFMAVFGFIVLLGLGYKLSKLDDEIYRLLDKLGKA